MNGLAHHVAKDVRHYRLLLVAWLASLALLHLLHAFVLPLLSTGWLTASAIDRTAGILTAAVFGGMVAVTVALIQEDSPGQVTSFWITRPVSPLTLLSGKLALLAVIFVIVPAVVGVLSAALAAVAPGHIFRLALTSMLAGALVLLPVAALAAVTRNLAQFVTAGLIAALGYFLISSALSARVLPLIPPRSETVLQSRVALSLALAAAAALAALVHQYRTRRTGRSYALLVSGAVLVFLAFLYWPWPLWREASAPVAGQAALELEKVKVGRLSLSSGSWEDGLQGYLVYQGVPPDTTLQPIDVRRMAGANQGPPAAGSERQRTAAGRTPARAPAVKEDPLDVRAALEHVLDARLSSAPPSLASGLRFMVRAQSVRARAERESRPERERTIYRIRTQPTPSGDHSVVHHGVPDGPMLDVAYELRKLDDPRLVLGLVARRYAVVAKAEPRAGAKYGADSWQGQVVGAERSAHELRFFVNEVAHLGGLTANPLFYVVRNAERGEAVLARVSGRKVSGRDQPLPTGNLLEWHTFELEFLPPLEGAGATTFDDEWMRGAELVVVEVANLGEFAVPVAYEAVAVRSEGAARQFGFAVDKAAPARVDGRDQASRPPIK